MNKRFTEEHTKTISWSYEIDIKAIINIVYISITNNHFYYIISFTDVSYY